MPPFILHFFLLFATLGVLIVPSNNTFESLDRPFIPPLPARSKLNSTTLLLANYSLTMAYRSWNPDCKVYVGNLQDNCLKSDVEGAFAKFGPLKNVWVARNPPGFAFVEFEDSRDAEDACRALDGT